MKDLVVVLITIASAVASLKVFTLQREAGEVLDSIETIDEHATTDAYPWMKGL